MSLIKLNAIDKIYPLGNQQVHAVQHLDLSIESGEFAVLAGPSGSGKTTVLNMIGALDRPSNGSVIVAGMDLTAANDRELSDFRLNNIGFIFQSYNLIPVLTAAENAEFPLMLQGVEKSMRHNRVVELFEQLGIAGLEDRRPMDLSGGQQQRVAVARSLISEPAVILADEPTANLDSHTSEGLLELMQHLNKEKGVTFVFSSHDPQVIACARRVVELHDGCLQRDSRTAA
ncbi:MAG: macrolide ABC transporter ATP-binding protein [Desulfuromonas sp.]|nr:MAG: macrolide ABC transporter ATP-binding protein [Desulfuromonas sp.]